MVSGGERGLGLGFGLGLGLGLGCGAVHVPDRSSGAAEGSRTAGRGRVVDGVPLVPAARAAVRDEHLGAAAVERLQLQQPHELVVQVAGPSEARDHHAHRLLGPRAVRKGRVARLRRQGRLARTHAHPCSDSAGSAAWVASASSQRIGARKAVGELVVLAARGL